MVHCTEEMLTAPEPPSKLETRGGRIVCPVCGAKTDQTVLPETRAVALPVFCKRCKTVTVVKIENGLCQRHCASA